MKSCVLLAGLLADGRTTVVESVATRDHTERMLRAAGARLTTKGSRISVERAERLDLGEIDVPGDFSSAAPFDRRGHAAARLGADPPGRRRESFANRPARRARAHGRADLASSTGGSHSGEPVADLEVTHAELVATEIGPARGAADDRRAAAVRARRVDGARHEPRARRCRAACQGVRSHRHGGRGAAGRRRPRAAPRQAAIRIRGVPTRPRGGEVERGRATTASPSSARSPGVVSQRGRSRIGARMRRRYRSPASTSFSTHSPPMIIAIDGPGRGRQEHGCTPPRGAAGRALPRHGRDVPGGDVACAARGDPARGRSTRLGELAAEHPVELDDRRHVAIAGEDVTAAIRETAHRPCRARRGARIRRCVR